MEGSSDQLLSFFVFIMFLYSVMRTFFPSTRHVLLGRGLKGYFYTFPGGLLPVAVVRMLLHVELAQSRLLLVVRLLLTIAHGLPPASENFANV